MRAGEDGQHVGIRLPLWVGPGQVADQRARAARGAVDKQRQVAGKQFAVEVRNEQAEAILLDEVEQPAAIRFGEMRGDVHRCKAWRRRRTERRVRWIRAGECADTVSEPNQGAAPAPVRQYAADDWRRP